MNIEQGEQAKSLTAEGYTAPHHHVPVLFYPGIPDNKLFDGSGN